VNPVYYSRNENKLLSSSYLIGSLIIDKILDFVVQLNNEDFVTF
jgi:hypothetical protein